VVPLPSSIEGLEHVIPHGAFRKWHYRRRRIEREGSVTYERATADTLDELLDALFALHGERWSTREMPGVLADGNVQAFHRDVAHALLDQGALRLYALRFDGRVSAVIYGFAHRGRTCFYIGGFDPADALLSPGSVIIGHAIEEAIREGCTAFDFLRGSETYKYRWGAVDTPTWCRTLTHAARPAESMR
jgi:CelD/BcsL family acetyltransferase involved in cellulose biosynthesis